MITRNPPNPNTDRGRLIDVCSEEIRIRIQMTVEPAGGGELWRPFQEAGRSARDGRVGGFQMISGSIIRHNKKKNKCSTADIRLKLTVVVCQALSR